jgi:hypothetical protein
MYDKSAFVGIPRIPTATNTTLSALSSISAHQMQQSGPPKTLPQPSLTLFVLLPSCLALQALIGAGPSQRQAVYAHRTQPSGFGFPVPPPPPCKDRPGSVGLDGCIQQEMIEREHQVICRRQCPNLARLLLLFFPHLGQAPPTSLSIQASSIFGHAFAGA